MRFFLRLIFSAYVSSDFRNTLYEPDISSILSGIDPSFNLSTVSSKNKESILKKIYEDLPVVSIQ